MSEENVRLVLALQASPDEDVAHRVRNDDVWAGLTAGVSSVFLEDCECTLPLFGREHTYVGMGGIRSAWLDWLEPWASYRSELKKAIDLGDRILLLVRDYGRRQGTLHEVGSDVAAIWTVRGGKIARIDYYADRAEALKAAGLED